MKGVEHFTSKAGFHVISIHYSADSERDPDTAQGQLWKDEESRGIPGGINSAQWRQEQEIDWNVTGGELVFPHVSMFKNKIVIPPFEIPSSWALYGSYDYGHRNPACFLVNAIGHDGDIYTVWEFYQAGVGYREQARCIKSCPYWSRLSYLPVADPSIWAETQEQTSESELKSIARLFFELPGKEQIVFAPGKKGGDITVAEKIRGDHWKLEDLEAGKQPRWRIFENCTKTIWELKNLRYEDWSPGMMQSRNLRESIVDKNNHAWDCFKMFTTQFYMAPGQVADDPLEKLKKLDPVSYQEWMKVRGMYAGTNASSLGDFE